MELFHKSKGMPTTPSTVLEALDLRYTLSFWSRNFLQGDKISLCRSLGSEPRQQVSAAHTRKNVLTTTPPSEWLALNRQATEASSKGPVQQWGKHRDPRKQLLAPASLYPPSAPKANTKSTPIRDTLARGSPGTGYLN